MPLIVLHRLWRNINIRGLQGDKKLNFRPNAVSWQDPTHSFLNIFIQTLLPLYSIYFPLFVLLFFLLNHLCSEDINHAGRETRLPAVMTYPLVMQRAAYYITHFINSVLLSLFHGLHPHLRLLLCLPGLWSSSVSLLIALPSQLRHIIHSEVFWGFFESLLGSKTPHNMFNGEQYNKLAR